MLLRICKYLVPVNGGPVGVKVFHRGHAQKPLREQWHCSNASVKVVGSGSPGDPASFVLSTNGSRHLFNCGEGSDRIARCNRILRWSNIENVFITHIDWSRIGGMLAVMKEILTSGRKANLTIHGPEKLQPIIERKCSISNLPTPKFNCTESVVIQGLQIDLLPLTNNHDKEADVMAYVCRLNAYNGRLVIEKCINLDVPIELISQLKMHEPIILPDGRLITPSDVHNFFDREKSFLVVDIPSLGYLRSLERSEAFNDLMTKQVEVVMHFSPSHVFEMTEYKQFVQQTNARCHFVLNENNKYSALLDAHRRQLQLNQLDHHIFPLLNSSVDTNPIVFDENELIDASVQNVCTNTVYLLRKAPKTEEEISEDSPDIEDNVAEADSIVTSATIDGVETVDRAKKYPKIVFLGTSSQKSGTVRNVSSILVHTSENSCILLDCGEGTCGQIIRFYGPKSNEIFAKIKAIFISHMHGDHHYGLFEILLQRKRLALSTQLPKLQLLIPNSKLAESISFCSDHVTNVSDEIHFVDNIDLLTSGLSHEMLAYLNLSSLQTCLVDHIESSFGISATIPTCTGNAPFKLTYSGDTNPCDSLVELGRNSTLLIHEATFENMLLEHAQRKKHSTIAQAIEQSEKMNAKYTILTHFSQRYTILPWIDGDLNENVGIAFDYMEVIEEDLCKLSALYPRMKIMFANHIKILEKNTTRYRNTSCFGI